MEGVRRREWLCRSTRTSSFELPANEDSSQTSGTVQGSRIVKMLTGSDRARNSGQSTPPWMPTRATGKSSANADRSIVFDDKITVPLFDNRYIIHRLLCPASLEGCSSSLCWQLRPRQQRRCGCRHSCPTTWCCSERKHRCGGGRQQMRR